MNRNIERMEDALQDEYEKEYKRMLMDEWEYWKRTGQKFNSPLPDEESEKWEYKGDTY